MKRCIRSSAVIASDKVNRQRGDMSAMTWLEYQY